ncbi:MAG: pyridoxal-dependent decarboxylase [Acidobacteriia bacterium]|nr:pyridoxal-dependent decarboxylase [Terriglobia bacterium]
MGHQPKKSRGVLATLDFNDEDLNSALCEATAVTKEYFDSVNEWRVFPLIQGKRLRHAIRERLPLEPTPPGKVIQKFRQTILENARHNLHPRFFGYVSSSGNPVGAIADLLTSTLNQNVTAWRSAPSAVEIELLAIDWIKEILGYPREAIGMFTSGGSLATLQALAIAREVKAGKNVSRNGMQILGRSRLILYMSEQGHMSIPKAAALLGLGKSSVRTVRADQAFRMELSDLERQIAQDRSRGHRPFCVVASAGTVNTGAIDDLEGISRIGRREGLWFHVDGAYGGFAALVPSICDRFRGIEKADSVSLDPHKWLYQPLDAGCILVRNRRQAYRTFSGSGEYAKVIAGIPGEDFAFFEHGIELSRRFRALKIWMAFKCYGARLLAACIEKNLRMAHVLETLVKANEYLEILAPVELSIVCFRYVPISVQKAYFCARPAQKQELDHRLNRLNEAIMTQLQREGRVYLSNAVLKGRFALRGCILSYRTEERDLRILIDEAVRIGRMWERKV